MFSNQENHDGFQQKPILLDIRLKQSDNQTNHSNTSNLNVQASKIKNSNHFQEITYFNLTIGVSSIFLTILYSNLPLQDMGNQINYIQQIVSFIISLLLIMLGCYIYTISRSNVKVKIKVNYKQSIIVIVALVNVAMLQELGIILQKQIIWSSILIIIQMLKFLKLLKYHFKLYLIIVVFGYTVVRIQLTQLDLSNAILQMCYYIYLAKYLYNKNNQKIDAKKKYSLSQQQIVQIKQVPPTDKLSPNSIQNQSSIQQLNNIEKQLVVSDEIIEQVKDDCIQNGESSNQEIVIQKRYTEQYPHDTNKENLEQLQLQVRQTSKSEVRGHHKNKFTTQLLIEKFLSDESLKNLNNSNTNIKSQNESSKKNHTKKIKKKKQKCGNPTLYQSILNSLRDGIAVIDSNLEVVYFNLELQQILLNQNPAEILSSINKFISISKQEQEEFKKFQTNYTHVQQNKKQKYCYSEEEVDKIVEESSILQHGYLQRSYINIGKAKNHRASFINMINKIFDIAKKDKQCQEIKQFKTYEQSSSIATNKSFSSSQDCIEIFLKRSKLYFNIKIVLCFVVSDDDSNHNLNEKCQKMAVLIQISNVTMQYFNTKKHEIKRYKLKMLASVSHEMRTPLNGSLNLLELLQTQDISQELVQIYVRPAYNYNRLLLSTINDLIDFAQIEAGTFVLNFEDFNLKDLLEDCISLLELRAQEKQLILELVMGAGIPDKIYADARRIQQILLNLLQNALKFTQQGKITLQAEQEENQIKILVRDTGIGIKEENLNKIFEAFGNSKKCKELKTKGAGLGLSISNLLAKSLNNMNGITVKSQINEGSEFQFLIFDFQDLEIKNIQDRLKEETKQIFRDNMTEVQDTEGRSAMTKNSQNLDFVDCNDIHSEEKEDDEDEEANYYTNNTQRIINLNITDYQSSSKWFEDQQNHMSKFGNNKHCSCSQILIIDDTEFNIMILQQLLQQKIKQFKADGALSCEKALIQIQNKRKNKCCTDYKIIFMDIDMPDKDGYQTTKEIQDYYRSINITTPKIIACTAFTSQDDRQKCQQIGMQGFISKPIKKEDIEQILKKNLSTNNK